MKAAFMALIKKIESKSLVSGDKATRVVLEFDSNDKLKELNALNELQKADKFVMAVIMDEREFRKYRKTKR